MKDILRVIASKVSVNAHVQTQVLATVAVSLLSVGGGFTFGFSAVLLPQLKNDPSFFYEETFDSWIASITPLAMVIGSLSSGLVSDALGRRMSQLVLTIPYCLGWVIMGVSNNNTVMLIGRFITGAGRGALRINSMVYIGESTDPKYRAVAFFCPSVAAHVGVLISHTVGKYFYWKTSCFLFTLPTILAFVLLVFLKESPLWLLSKGKIDEGILTFRQFRGNGENAEKELATILERAEEKLKEITTFKNTLNIVFSKPFMKSVGTIFLLFLAVQWSGVTTLIFYAQMIFEKTFSGDIDAFMLMLVTDSIRIASGVFFCIFAKWLPRKKSFIVCCVTTTIVLIGLVIYLYLSPVGLAWVAVICMILYIAVAGIMMSIAWSFVSEIFPSKVRGFGSGLSTAISLILLFTSVKLTPDILNRFGEKVMYGSYAGVIMLTGLFLSFILPETNGRSLQDIEDSLYKNKSDDIKDGESVTSTKL